jgi:hypothetical protein
MLLHVSSFSPAPTPRPYSPMVVPMTPHPQMFPSAEDDRLGASLSRTRNAIPHISSRLATPLKERSMLPQQAVAV